MLKVFEENKRIVLGTLKSPAKVFFNDRKIFEKCVLYTKHIYQNNFVKIMAKIIIIFLTVKY
jgi:hypothetical protein